MTVQAIPMRYQGTDFRSTLEASWAATFDFYSIDWEYEPLAVSYNNIKYLPDFYLPVQRVWAEVKGPMDDRLDKAIDFQAALNAADTHEWEFNKQLVIILRPSQKGMCVWEGTMRAQHIVMVRCPACTGYGFMDNSGPWRCRRGCPNPSNKFWLEPGGDRFFSGDLPFVNALRPAGRAA